MIRLHKAANMEKIKTFKQLKIQLKLQNNSFKNTNTRRATHHYWGYAVQNKKVFIYWQMTPIEGNTLSYSKVLVP